TPLLEVEMLYPTSSLARLFSFSPKCGIGDRVAGWCHQRRRGLEAQGVRPQLSIHNYLAWEDPMPEAKKARAVGVNHVALEVGDIEEALSFYGQIFQFQLRGKREEMAFIDLGDQFLALQRGRRQPSDDGRHFG